MESEFLETLFLPWWKGLVYIFAITLAIVTIRVTIKLDSLVKTRFEEVPAI